VIVAVFAVPMVIHVCHVPWVMASQWKSHRDRYGGGVHTVKAGLSQPLISTSDFSELRKCSFLVLISKCIFVKSNKSNLCATPFHLSMSQRQGWYRHYFLNHPELQQGAQSAYANLKEKRPKVICQCCLDVRIAGEQEKDAVDLQNGLRHEYRSREEILSSCKCDLQSHSIWTPQH